MSRFLNKSRDEFSWVSEEWSHLSTTALCLETAQRGNNIKVNHGGRRSKQRTREKKRG